MKSGTLFFRHCNVRIGTIVLCYIAFMLGVNVFPVHGANSFAKDEMQLINESIEQIRLNALVSPKSKPRMTIDILKTYVQSLDEYSDYLTKEEYVGFRESANSDYFGVHMDIQKKGGVIYLFPFKGGIAEKKGIQPSDELIAVNGEPVYGKSVFVVGSHIRGKEGGTIQLIVRSGKGLARTISLRRQKAHYDSVRAKNTPSAHYVQITRFTDDTDKMLSRCLNGIGYDTKTIVIDLRGNQGGSLYIAQACADLFLKKGATVYKLRSRNGMKEILAERPQNKGSNIVLLQDGNTASAAEVFIAALACNGRALSVGRKTYGKGLAQRFLPLSDGSALLLTYGELITPDNLAFHGRGLEPDILLPEELLSEDFSDDETLPKLFAHIQSKHQ